MNIALEQTEEYVNGQLKNKYGDAFIRGNNGKHFYGDSFVFIAWMWTFSTIRSKALLDERSQAFLFIQLYFSELFKTRKARYIGQWETLDGMKRLQNNFHVSKTKSLFYYIHLK